MSENKYNNGTNKQIQQWYQQTHVSILKLVYTVCPTRYRTRLAGGPLLRVATIRRTTDTH
jgi:hypothetical protein